MKISGKNNMNIYDFDKTIYKNDSSIDFYKFCIKKNRKVLLILPKFFIYIVLYSIKIIEKERLKSCFFSFVKYFNDIESVAYKFWEEKKYELKDFYINQQKKSDIIISASPEFLLKPVSKKYGFKLIATKHNLKTGELIGKNCYGEEKVKRLNEIGITTCNQFYSDSFSDSPLSKIASKAFIVDGNEITPWNEKQESLIKKIKHTFINRDFITFVAIGIINAFNGIWIAYVYSLFITNPITAYIFGFLTSLMIAYVLNSLLNFKEKLKLDKLIKFIISNIPNFIIQIASVVILIEILKWSKLVSYAISAVIAVPITFILVKMKVFKK